MSSRSLVLSSLLVACGNPGSSTPDAAPDAPPTSSKRIVILMIGDGMGSGQLAAASHYKHGAAGKLFLETLPVRGEVITSGPSGTTDSAAAATTMATGVRTYNGSIGLDRDDMPIKTVVELAHEVGLPAGVVATSSLPHATPGGFTAHRSSRHDLTQIADDQARLVKPDVMLGGGAQYFLPAGQGSLRGDDGLLDDLAAAGYTIARTRDELVAAPTSGKLAGIFATDHLAYTIARPTDTTEPTLTEMSLTALDRLEAASPDGFFLMIEGSRIDMASHGNMLAEAVGETVAFDDTIAAVSAWADAREDVTLIVTADHECGGLEVVQGNGAGALPTVAWRWGNHTNAPVSVFARGPGTDGLGGTIDHRYVHAVIASRITGEPFVAPPTDSVADGRLADVAHLAATQTNASGFGAGYNQLDELRLATTDRALAVGVTGVFQQGKNAVVLLVDVDFGASTGLARLDNALSDTTGRADAILSSLSLDAPATSGFGADFAAVSWGAEDPWIELQLADAGLRGLRAPFGSASNLGWHGIATNFGDGTKALASPAPPVSPIAGRGWEVHLPYAVLYPSGIPAGATLAVAAVLVNDDGGFTSNQALPPFVAGTMNPGRTLTALPGIVVFTIDSNGDGAVDPISASTVMP